jgi:hypothetical protein
MLSLQHDTGRWCTEYSYSADDGLWGARVLHNFGRLAGEAERERTGRGQKRVDEEEAMEGGLKGRFSAGAEVHFSAKEKSAGGTLVICPLSRWSFTTANNTNGNIQPDDGAYVYGLRRQGITRPSYLFAIRVQRL